MSNEVSTSVNNAISIGLSLLQDETPDYSKLKIRNFVGREIGLQLLQFGIAQSEARRVSRLYSTIIELESKIFDPDKLKRLSDDEKIVRYELAKATMAGSLNYVKSVSDNMNWSALEVSLIGALNSQESSGAVDGRARLSEHNISEAAGRLLHELSSGTDGK